MPALVALGLLSSKSARAEWNSVQLSEASMKVRTGEKLVVRTKNSRVVDISLKVRGIRWQVPQSAYDMPFTATTNGMMLYVDGTTDQRGVFHAAYLLVIEGAIGPDPANSKLGEVNFEFEDGRLVRRVLTVTEGGADSEISSVKY